MRRVLMAAALGGLVSTGLLSLPAWADMQPGMYETTATTTTTGVPPQTDTHSECMMPQDAKDPVAGLIAGMSNGGTCNFSNKSQTSDHFTSDYTCESQGQKIAGHIDMAFTATSIDGTIVVTADTPQGKQTVTTTIKSMRKGDCS